MNVPKYVGGKKKTVYRKNGKFVKNDTEGAKSIEVDTLREDKTEMKNAFKKKLRELRENARIKQKIELENERAKKDL